MRGSRGGSWSGKNWSRRGGDWGRHGNWSGKKWARHGNWSGKNWSRHGNWNRGHWSGRRWNYDHYDNWWPGYATGIILSLGLPRYGYYDPYLYGETYPRRVYRTSSAHVAWCYDRWRSYRESDNSYQPFNGPRRQCRSPYG